LLELKMAVEQSGDGIALAGLDGHIVFVNKAWAEMHGCAAADLIGQHLSVFHTPEQLENEVNPFNERVIATESNTGEMGHCRKDGTTFITQMAVTVVNDATGTPFRLLAAARDITERKQAEAEREKLQTQVLQAQKMQSVGLLAGGVAHDFNNMLGIILGHTELAMARVEPGGSLHADLAEIRMAAQCSADLTRQILAFARKQTITPKVLDLNDTVEGMLKMLRRLIGEEIDLDWKPGPGLCPVKMDPTQIDQILANLCINARDAISGVGKITVSTRNTALDEKSCARLGGGTPGEYVMLSVSDDGCGMDSETLLLIFDPFYTTKEIGKGTGLGLATVYGIVKQNQGFINASSEPGQGATFTIHLPRHAAGMEPDAGKAPDQAVSSGHETILVVEDEPALLKMATIVMESQGYTVLAAGCPAEAIRMAGEHAGRIDLLLTDVVMPGMNGRDLAKSLVSTCPGLKRLFMSGYTADIIARHGVMDEGAHFIQKPFSLKDLAAKLREALEE
jgi:PAS domain S-box-containing protein